MATLDESIAAIKDGAKEDRFTYLTILQYHVKSPEVLPTLYEVLQDTQLTQDIGWDLVQLLLDIEGSEPCLETVARLGNPREVIIKVMEALEGLSDAEDAEQEEDGEAAGASSSKSSIPSKFIMLLGMLAILHHRIMTKYPSRFLGPSLVKVYEAYLPTPEMTAAVVNLVRALSGTKRPALPSRKSSVNILDPAKNADESKNAPDPEAEQEDPTEKKLQNKLLQAFVTCVLQRYTNKNEMKWSPRLLETYFPERNIPGKKTTTQAFREDQQLLQRDSVVGNLVALACDLGLVECSTEFFQSVFVGPPKDDPLISFADPESPDDINLSLGGVVCLIAYWIFSRDVFEADQPQPEIHIFPEHLSIMERFLGLTPQEEIVLSPGTADALLAIGLGLHHRKLISSNAEEAYMAYHHHLTLISVFHPDIQVRNAATTFAGTVLHADPDDQNRLEILEDLLENCMFGSLKACAVVWLKEEIIAARQQKLSNQFSNSDVIDRLQYTVFPDMMPIKEMSDDLLAEYWAQNSVFLLHVANFAYFLFSGYKDLMPPGMGPAVEQRFVEPLLAAAEKLSTAGGADGEGAMQIGVLIDRLKSLPSV